VLAVAQYDGDGDGRAVHDRLRRALLRRLTDPPVTSCSTSPRRSRSPPAHRRPHCERSTSADGGRRRHALLDVGAPAGAFDGTTRRGWKNQKMAGVWGFTDGEAGIRNVIVRRVNAPAA
jgi:hypothetical protein